VSEFTLGQLLNDGPLLHELPTGEPHSHGLRPYVLEFPDNHLWQGANTLETGAGLSTIIFAYKDCAHVCITPIAEVISKIQQFCRSRSVSLDSVQFINERSQNALPSLGAEESDLALIDGDHSFPVAFVDFL